MLRVSQQMDKVDDVDDVGDKEIYDSEILKPPVLLILDILSLPIEIQIFIFSFVSLPDTRNVRLTCTTINKIISADEFWHERFVSHFLHLYDKIIIQEKNINWFDEFILARNIEYNGSDRSFQTLLDFTKDGDHQSLKRKEDKVIDFINSVDINHRSMLKWAYKKYSQTHDPKFKETLRYLFNLLPQARGMRTIDILIKGVRYGISDIELNFLVNQEVISQFGDKYRKHPLHQAARYNRVGILEFLLERYTNVDSDADGITALFVAVKNNHLGAVNVLLTPKYKARHLPLQEVENSPFANKSQIHFGDYPIHIAAKLGYSSIMDELLNVYPQSINEVTSDNATSLLLATENGHTALIKKLITKNARTDIPLVADIHHYHSKFSVRVGDTVLHAAVLSRQPKTIQMLLDNKADPDIRGYANNTPLHYLAEKGTEGILPLMLKAGVSLDLVNKDHWSALGLALKNNHHRIVRELLQAGANTSIHIHCKAKLGAYSSSLELFDLINQIDQFKKSNKNNARDKLVTELKELANRVRLEYINEEEKIQELIALIKPKINVVEKIDWLTTRNHFTGLKHKADDTILPARRAAIDHLKLRISLAYEEKISPLQLERELIALVNIDKVAEKILNLSYSGRFATYKQNLKEITKLINNCYIDYILDNGNLFELKNKRIKLYQTIAEIFTTMKNTHNNKFGKIIRAFGRSKTNDDFINDIDNTYREICHNVLTVNPLTAQFIKLLNEINNYQNSTIVDSRQHFLENLRIKSQIATFDYNGRNASNLTASLSKELDFLKLRDKLIHKFNINFNHSENKHHENAINKLKIYIDKVYKNEITYYELEKQFYLTYEIERIEKLFSTIQYRGKNTIFKDSLNFINDKIKQAYKYASSDNCNVTGILSSLQGDLNQAYKSIQQSSDQGWLSYFTQSNHEHNFIQKINIAYSNLSPMKKTISLETLKLWDAISEINLMMHSNHELESETRVLAVKSLFDFSSSIINAYTGQNHHEINYLCYQLKQLKWLDNFYFYDIGQLCEANDNSHRKSAIQRLEYFAFESYKNYLDKKSFDKLKQKYSLFCELDNIVKSHVAVSYQGRDGTYKKVVEEVKSCINEAYDNFAKATDIIEIRNIKIQLRTKLIFIFNQVENHDQLKYGRLAFFGRSSSDSRFFYTMEQMNRNMAQIDTNTIRPGPRH